MPHPQVEFSKLHLDHAVHDPATTAAMERCYDADLVSGMPRARSTAAFWEFMLLNGSGGLHQVLDVLGDLPASAVTGPDRNGSCSPEVTGEALWAVAVAQTDGSGPANI